MLRWLISKYGVDTPHDGHTWSACAWSNSVAVPHSEHVKSESCHFFRGMRDTRPVWSPSTSAMYRPRTSFLDEVSVAEIPNASRCDGLASRAPESSVVQYSLIRGIARSMYAIAASGSVASNSRTLVSYRASSVPSMPRRRHPSL